MNERLIFREDQTNRRIRHEKKRENAQVIFDCMFCIIFQPQRWRLR